MGYIYLNGVIGRLESLCGELTALPIYKEFKRTVSGLHAVRKLVEDAWLTASINPDLAGEAARRWLKQVEEVADEVDDWIDEVEMNNRQIQLQRNQVSSSLFRFKLTNSPKPEFIHSLQNIANELERMAGLADTCVIYAKSNSLSLRGGSIPFVDTTEVIGREGDKRAVVKLIERGGCGGGHERVSVIPIVGMLGVGKTTLAQLIIRWGSLRDRFSPVLWQSLCKDCPDISHWLRQLSKQASSNVSLDDDDDTQDPKMELQKHLESKRFLIVLDDFGDNILHKSLVRELIGMGSNSSDHTSVIIVVTRSRRAAASVGTMPAYKLEPLSPKDLSDDLLLGYTQRYVGVGNSVHPIMHGIAYEIVELCGRLPFMINFLVQNGHDKDLRETLQLLQDSGIKGIMDESSILSYSRSTMIPCHLKLPLQSFHLQKACGLSVEALICVWMALGLLYSDDPAQQQQQQPHPEHIGRKYLADLVESELCPDVEYAPGGVVRHLQFNDALFDLFTATPHHPSWFIPHRKSSQSSLQSFTRYIIWDEDNLPKSLFPSLQSSTRYIIWDEDNLPESLFPSPNKVRLFILCIKGQASAVLVRDIISHLKWLRVLAFGGCDIEMLPDSIGELKHLRYLDVGRNARMKSLPDSICNLWHLQTLFLHGCSQLEQLPVEIGRFQNLRYLTLTLIKESLPEAIGKLTSLRTLALASCPRLASLPRTFKNLNNLETLGIVGCPQLDLTADSSVEGLKGIEAIQTLLISHLPKFASLHSDLGNPSVSMKHLLIQSCPSLKDTTWITQFRTLRSLTLEDCPQLSALIFTDGVSQFNDLVELVIRRCPSLRDTAWIRQFMSLRSLIIDGCRKLAELDAGFPELKKLERLEIRSCPRLTEWFASPTAKDSRHIAHVRVIELDGVRLES